MGQNGLSNWDCVAGLENLVDKSLVYLQEEEARFFMLETIKEFASDELQKAQKDRDFKLAHISYYLNLAEESSIYLSGSDSEYWSSILFKEHANLRAAIDYAIELNEIKLAYRFGLALRTFWIHRGMVIEGHQQLSKNVDDSRCKMKLYVYQLQVEEALANHALLYSGLQKSYKNIQKKSCILAKTIRSRTKNWRDFKSSYMVLCGFRCVSILAVSIFCREFKTCREITK